MLSTHEKRNPFIGLEETESSRNDELLTDDEGDWVPTLTVDHTDTIASCLTTLPLFSEEDSFFAFFQWLPPLMDRPFKQFMRNKLKKKEEFQMEEAPVDFFTHNLMTEILPALWKKRRDSIEEGEWESYTLPFFFDFNECKWERKEINNELKGNEFAKPISESHKGQSEKLENQKEIKTYTKNIVLKLSHALYRFLEKKKILFAWEEAKLLLKRYNFDCREIKKKKDETIKIFIFLYSVLFLTRQFLIQHFNSFSFTIFHDFQFLLDSITELDTQKTWKWLESEQKTKGATNYVHQYPTVSKERKNLDPQRSESRLQQRTGPRESREQPLSKHSDTPSNLARQEIKETKRKPHPQRSLEVRSATERPAASKYILTQGLKNKERGRESDEKGHDNIWKHFMKEATRKEEECAKERERKRALASKHEEMVKKAIQEQWKGKKKEFSPSSRPYCDFLSSPLSLTSLLPSSSPTPSLPLALEDDAPPDIQILPPLSGREYFSVFPTSPCYLNAAHSLEKKALERREFHYTINDAKDAPKALVKAIPPVFTHKKFNKVVRTMGNYSKSLLHLRTHSTPVIESEDDPVALSCSQLETKPCLKLSGGKKVLPKTFLHVAKALKTYSQACN